MPEFTSLVRPAGPAVLRRTELSARIDFFLRTGFFLGAFFFKAIFSEAFFLGVVFLRTFFLVGIRKVYHYQILRTTHGFCQTNYLPGGYGVLLTGWLSKVESSSGVQHLTTSSVFSKFYGN
jgi:hypothetical protein